MIDGSDDAVGFVSSIENMLAVLDVAEENAAAGIVAPIPGAARVARDIVTGKLGDVPYLSATIDACAYALMAGDPSALEGIEQPDGQDWPEEVLSLTGMALVFLVRGEPNASQYAHVIHASLRERRAAEEKAFVDAAEPGLGARRAAFRAGVSYFVSAGVTHMALGRQDLAEKHLRSASRFSEASNDIFLVNAARALALACATSPLLVRTAAPAPEEVAQAGAPTAPDAPVP